MRLSLFASLLCVVALRCLSGLCLHAGSSLNLKKGSYSYGMNNLAKHPQSVEPRNSSIGHFKESFPFILPAQWEKIKYLENLVSDWNLKINLVSRSDINNLFERHIVPSLSIVTLQVMNPGNNVIDIGTGGGFPGLPIAIACPNIHFTLLDKSPKKMKVVAEIVRSLGLHNVEVVTSRVEHYRGDSYDFVLGRSVASLPKFLSSVTHLLAKPVAGSGSKENDATGVAEKEGGVLYIKGGDISRANCSALMYQT
jgi:16S rRNA (guanine527-N7)-methyltransferase